ncbi:MAG: response regulator transcription factor [Bacteroidota bacterium]|nr:response regulator transcription factor [Bacteroidota bacterium]
MNVIRVFLADDHALVRAGFRSLLQSFHGIEVVGEAEDGQGALKLLKEKQADILLLDVSMKGLNGLEVLGRVSKLNPRIRVIMLSMHANEEYVVQALKDGACGYLLKDAGMGELELAVRSVARGEIYLSPAVSKYIVDEYLRRGDTNGPSQQRRPFEGLTSRQREILQLIAEGHSTKEIAAKLDLSVKTVDSHRTELMTRLGIHDIAGLVRYAIRVGLISSEK